MIKVEDKELLINDLCGRFHYGVICNIEGHGNKKLLMIEEDGPNTLFDFGDDNNGYPIQIYASEVKPYLFPISLMTKEQKEELLYEYGIIIDDAGYIDSSLPYDDSAYLVYFDYLNKYHFDYRGLIEKGLALNATNLNIYQL